MTQRRPHLTMTFDLNHGVRYNEIEGAPGERPIPNRVTSLDLERWEKERDLLITWACRWDYDFTVKVIEPGMSEIPPPPSERDPVVMLEEMMETYFQDAQSRDTAIEQRVKKLEEAIPHILYTLRHHNLHGSIQAILEWGETES